MINEKYKSFFEDVKEVKQLEKYIYLFSSKDKEQIDMIEKVKPDKNDEFYNQFLKVKNVSPEIAISLSKSKNTPKNVIKVLIDIHMPVTRLYLMQRNDLDDVDKHELISKTTTNEWNQIFSDPYSGQMVNEDIKNTILNTAITDMSCNKKLKQYQINVFSCSNNIEKMTKVLEFPAVPEQVIAAIINNPFILNADFIDKCFNLGCDFNDLKIKTPYIINVVYRVSAETITEIEPKTKKETEAQLNALKIMENLINNSELIHSQREDLYERLENMKSSHPMRSTLLKLLIKTEVDNIKLNSIMHSDLSITFKRLAASNPHCISSAKTDFVHKEIENLCDKLPTAISPFNFVSNVVKNTQLKKESYLRLINKHLSATTNKKLTNVIKDIALSQATPITILDILSETEIYPDIQFIATLNLHCKLQPCQRGTFQTLLDVCIYDRSIKPDFEYNAEIKKIINNILEDESIDNSYIKDTVQKVKKLFEETEKPDYKYSLTLNEYNAERNDLIKQIMNECNDSLYTFYLNVDKYAQQYEDLTQKLKNGLDKQVQEEIAENNINI